MPGKSFNEELRELLNQADKITLRDLEFDRLFKEQGAILCDIRSVLKDGAACKLISQNPAQERRFTELYNTMRKVKSGVRKQSKPRPKSEPKSKRYSRKKSGMDKKSGLGSGSRSMKGFNNRFPIVILKKSKKNKQQPNVLWLNNTRKSNSKK